MHRPFVASTRRTLTIALSLALIGISLTFEAPQTSAESAFCSESGPLSASDLPKEVPLSVCNLVGRVVRDRGAGLTIGPPGTGVYTEELIDDGSIEEFQAYTHQDRTVEFFHVGGDWEAAPTDAEPASASPHPCNDGANNFKGWDESDDHHWRFNRGTAPTSQGSNEPNLTRDEVVDALRRGTTDITHENNDCGWPDVIDAAATYQGDTERSAQMDGSGDCVSYWSKDEVNVVGFGDLPASKVGKMCAWYIPTAGEYDELAEADIRFNKKDHNWTNHPSWDSCDGDYDIESVMAHERGHVFGLAHVDESNHAYLTMSERVKACTNGQRTLGRGDMQGLNVIYNG